MTLVLHLYAGGVPHERTLCCDVLFADLPPGEGAVNYAPYVTCPSGAPQAELDAANRPFVLHGRMPAPSELQRATGGTMTTTKRFDWEDDPRLLMPEAGVHACAYNAAVNYGSGRAAKKMGDLIRAINRHLRIEGVVKLDFLVSKGVIDGYTDCPDGCEMRPGGLFHVVGCENDMNHPVSKARREKAREMLPERQTYAASVSLVGHER